jgi:PAS domain S-box-containing protein
MPKPVAVLFTATLALLLLAVVLSAWNVTRPIDDSRPVVAHLTAFLATLLACSSLLLLAGLVLRDLRKRMQVEEALRKQEEEFRTAFDRSGAAKAHAHPNTGQFLRVNRKFCTMIGYSEEELKNLTFKDLTHPDDCYDDSATFRMVLRGETNEGVSTKRYLRKDGAILWIYLNATLILDPAGQPLYTVAILEDVTEQKLAEEALRESEARFRLLADALPQIVWTTTADGALNYCNQRWQDYTGLNVQQAAGRGSHQAIHPDDRAAVDRVWETAFRSGGVFETELRLRRVSDGAYRWHLSRALPLRRADLSGRQAPPVVDAKDGLIGWFGTSTDIEDQKRAEQAVLQANEDLERRVAERTGQLRLTNEELRQASQVADAANRAKSEFLASISHEIRTPLNGILGMTEIALDTKLTSQQRDYLQVVKVSAQTLLTLLNDILDFSRIEAGKLELKPAPLALRREVEETLQSLAVRAVNKGLRWSCSIAPDVPDQLVGDVVRLRQVLLSLVSNAVKFTHQGEVFVRVSKEELATEITENTEKRAPTSPSSFSVSSVSSVANSSLLRFEVRDTGIGIAADKRGSIFDPFVQGDGSLNKQYSGTGLGLSIASRLVEMMGGRIEVHSEVGQGSTFSFTLSLPLADPQAAGAPPARPRSQAVGPPAAGPGLASPPAMRILLVEDNIFNQQVGAYMLERQGHKVVVAGSGQDALNRLAEQKYDLVLMDVQMPGMDGLEATKAIRRREAGGQRVAIVALTAQTGAEDRQRSLDAGMDGHLSKPLDPAQLAQLVRQVQIGALVSHSPAGGDLSRAEAVEMVVQPEPPMLFDAARTLERLNGNRRMLVEVSKLFVESSTTLLAAMHTALAARDLPTLHRSAHTLKGSMSFFTAPAAIEAARRVERVGNNFEEANEAFHALTRVVEQLQAELTGAAREYQA